MVIENRLVHNEVPPATASGPDAYEVYWRSADNANRRRPKNDFSAVSDSWDCGAGDAYSELWQHWDGQ